MSAFEVWNVFRRRWWIVAVLAVVGGASALLYSLSLPPTYRAHAEVVVLPSRAEWELSLFLEARMRTYRAVLLSFPKTQGDLPQDLGDRMHVQLVTEEGLVLIEVDDHDPQRAADLANLLANRLQTWVDENAPSGGVYRLYVSTLLPAQAPAAPSSPRYKVNTLAGFVLGLVLGLPLVFLWDFWDDTVDEPARAAARLGIAVWPALPPFPPDEVLFLRDPTGEAAASFHRLYTYLRLAGVGEVAGEGRCAWHTLAVSGVTPRDLPPALLANLGAAIAGEGSTVLLVDADLGRPALHEPLALPAAPGLGDLLPGGGLDRLVPVETVLAGLSLLPAGKALPPADRAIALHRAAQALPNLAQSAETVLVRFPDPREVPEGLFLAAQADAVLLVGRAGRTRGRDVRRALEILHAAQARVLGLALWREGRPR